MFRRAVVPLHLKEPTERLHELIVLLHRMRVESVRLIHVAAGPGASRRTAPRLEDIADELKRSGYAETGAVDAQTVIGSTTTGVLQAARGCGAELIAVPWKRKNWVQRSLLGSTTLDLIRRSDIPVLVHKYASLGALDGVERSSEQEERGEPLSLLYATDLRSTDDYVFPIVEGGWLGRPELTIATINERAPDPRSEADRRSRVERALQELADRAARVAHSVETVAEIGNTKRRLPRLARALGVELVLLGKSSSGGLGEVLGSVAEEVAYRSRSSVLIVPPEDER
jgi:nucleotide-binding universal stress UspA family protein